MSKLTLCLALFVVCAVASITADGVRACSGRCDPKLPSRRICASDRDGRTCRRLTACRLRERNCRLRELGLPLLRETSLDRCRRIRGTATQGPCATRKIEPIRRGKKLGGCRNIRCDDDKITSCWRTKDRRCALLTRCEARRRNCERGSDNALVRTDRSSCRDLRRGDGLRRCRSRKD